jgi:TPR repeat protein
MKRLARYAALALMLMPAISFAQDYNAGLQAYSTRDYATALREWTPLAEQGDKLAQYNLGYIYLESKGVPQDFAEAAKWFQLAAKQGNSKAQYNLGNLYLQGHGVPQDNIKAHMWFNLSGASGDPQAQLARDVVASSLLPADLSEAQRRATACVASSYRDCD